jgi:hypothetical protein
MHRSRLSTIVIDCQADDLDDATAFWSAALARPAGEADALYAELQSPAGEPKILLQKVDHPSRVHLDIETDDLEAEVARLETLGARRIGDVKRWVVMEAPTGHRFCVVRPQRPDFPGDATEWES